MAGSLLAIVLAAAALAVLNSTHNPGKPAEEIPPALQPSPVTPSQPAAPKGPVQDDAAARVETAFANQPIDRKSGRPELREALANPALDSAVRQTYLEVSGNRIRLRNTPAETALVLRTLRRGAYVRLKGRADQWCEVSLSQGPTGWMKCDFLKPIIVSPSDPAFQAREEAARP